MGMFDEMKDKVADLAGQHGDKVEEHSDAGLDRAEEMAGERFGEQHGEHIGQGRDLLDERIGEGGGDEGQQPV
jgi:hypothetical protein